MRAWTWVVVVLRCILLSAWTLAIRGMPSAMKAELLVVLGQWGFDVRRGVLSPDKVCDDFFFVGVASWVLWFVFYG